MKKIMVVPIDDRPVQMYNLEQAALASGIEILFPPKHLIETKIDQTLSGTGFKFGNPLGLRDWIRANKNSVDGFIISADQLASGGLIGSRALKTGTGAPPSLSVAKTYLDVLKELPTNKPRFVFDTIMRLASSTFVQGLTMTEYANIRNYSQVARQSFWTVNDIINNYERGTNGVNINYSSYGLSLTLKNQVVAARKRKFLLNEHLIQVGEQGGYDYLVIGLDDAAKTGVQLNEAGWLKARMHWGLKQSEVEGEAILAEADGLAHTLLARMSKVLNGAPTQRVKVHYYGPASERDGYDYFEHETRKTNVDKHIKLMGGVLVGDTDACDVEVLVSLPGATATNRANLVTRISNNATIKMPTIVIDDQIAVGNTVQADAILAGGKASTLLSYSGWGTFGNSVGIGMGAGLSRLHYLRTNSGDPDMKAAANAQLRTLYRSFVKDVGYLKKWEPSMYLRGWIVDTLSPAVNGGVKQPNAYLNFKAHKLTDSQINQIDNQIRYLMNQYESGTAFPAFRSKPILGSLQQSVSYTTTGTYAFSDYSIPWGRSYETDCKPKISLI